MGKGAIKFGSEADKAFLRAQKRASQFKSITGGILTAGVISRGFGLMQRAVRSVGEEFLEFDKSITVAAAKFPDRIKRGTRAFEELKKAARETGATTEYTAAQAASGLEEFAKAGIDANTAMALLPATAELATNANVEFAQAADFALTALDAFNLRSKDAAKTAENLKRVNDTLTAVVNSAKLEIEDFNETLKFTGPVADTLGASLEDVAVLTGVVAKAGIKGSLAGTALKNTYLGLSAATPQAKKKLEELGVKAINPLTGDMRDALDILIDFKKATDDMGTAQKVAAINTVFGRRAISGVSKIMSLSTDELEEYSRKINASKDASKLMAEEIRKSLSNRLEVLKSTLFEVGFRFFEAFEKDGKKGLEAFIAAARDFDVKPIVEEVKTIFSAMKSLFEFLWDNRVAIKTLVKAFIAFKVAMAGIGIARAIRDFGSLAKAIWKAVYSQQAMAKIGVTKALPPGVAGPAAPMAAPVAGVGQLAKSATGVMTAVGSALAAAVAGVAIGTMIEEAFTGPMNEAATKIRWAAEDAIRVAEEAIRTKDPELMVEASKDLAKASKDMTDKTSIFGIEVSKQLVTTESAVESFTGFLTAIGSVFSDEIERTQSPIERYRDELQELKNASVQLGNAMAEATAKIKAGQSTINVNVNNAPTGTTIETKTEGQGAPPVNVNQSGQNP